MEKLTLWSAIMSSNLVAAQEIKKRLVKEPLPYLARPLFYLPLGVLEKIEDDEREGKYRKKGVIKR